MKELQDFLKGVGKGLLGVVSKPTSGAINFVSQGLQGIGNTPGYLLENKVDNVPLRPSRYIPPNLKVIVPFNLEESVAYWIMMKLVK